MEQQTCPRCGGRVHGLRHPFEKEVEWSCLLCGYVFIEGQALERALAAVADETGMRDAAHAAGKRYRRTSVDYNMARSR